jgi:hypothetical protein
VKRRRSSAPGRLRPDGRWFHPILLVALLAALLAACGQATSTDQQSGAAEESPDAIPTETAPPDPSIDTPTVEPSATDDRTTPEPTAIVSSAPSGSGGGTGSASSCSGSDENRDFFASMAAAVDWTVYCPVLPDGWFVEDGQYRLAGGGWMEISYNGPGDARIVLRQGAFCEAADACVPGGTDVGETTFGDRTGTLLAVADGSWAVVVDRGATPTWLLVVQGLDDATARSIAGDLLAVAA